MYKPEQNQQQPTIILYYFPPIRISTRTSIEKYILRRNETYACIKKGKSIHLENRIGFRRHPVDRLSNRLA